MYLLFKEVSNKHVGHPFPSECAMFTQFDEMFTNAKLNAF